MSNEAIKAGGGIGWSGQNNPRCPHCGEIMDIAAHDAYELYEEDTYDIECPHCNKEYRVEAYAAWKFTVEEAES